MERGGASTLGSRLMRKGGQCVGTQGLRGVGLDSESGLAVFATANKGEKYQRGLNSDNMFCINTS